MKNSGSTLGGMLLIAGTSIGGGMLALPVLTSAGGFLPSLVIYFLCWLFMASTGLLFLEISLWMPEESNIITMAKRTLGRWAEIAAWGLYLFLFYCLVLAYIVGCGSLVTELLGGHSPTWLGPVLFLLFFAPFVYGGAHLVGKLNFFLMAGLGISFLAFVIVGAGYVDSTLLMHVDWGKSLLALPICFTAFAYQGTIPTLIHYLNYDPKRCRIAIIAGSLIPLVAYIIWQWLILGIVPTFGPGGLIEAVQKGQNAVQPLKNFIQKHNIYLIGQFFAFFALVTSFLGVSLGLVDFLADGLKIKKNNQGKLILMAMVLLPPFVLSLFYPHVFLLALDYAGGFGCALLLGLLPILMVWSGRYQRGLKGEYTFSGGKPILVLMAVFVLFELMIEILT